MTRTASIRRMIALVAAAIAMAATPLAAQPIEPGDRWRSAGKPGRTAGLWRPFVSASDRPGDSAAPAGSGWGVRMERPFARER